MYVRRVEPINAYSLARKKNLTILQLRTMKRQRESTPGDATSAMSHTRCDGAAAGPPASWPPGPQTWVQQPAPWPHAPQTGWYQPCQHCQQLVPCPLPTNSWHYGNPPPSYWQPCPWPTIHYSPPPSTHAYWQPWPGPGPIQEAWQQPAPMQEPACCPLQPENSEGGDVLKQEIVEESFFTMLPCRRY